MTSERLRHLFKQFPEGLGVLIRSELSYKFSEEELVDITLSIIPEEHYGTLFIAAKKSEEQGDIKEYYEGLEVKEKTLSNEDIYESEHEDSESLDDSDYQSDEDYEENETLEEEEHEDTDEEKEQVKAKANVVPISNPYSFHKSATHQITNNLDQLQELMKKGVEATEGDETVTVTFNEAKDAANFKQLLILENLLKVDRPGATSFILTRDTYNKIMAIPMHLMNLFRIFLVVSNIL